MRAARAALVVDDSAAVRRQLRLALERLDLRVDEAGDGADGWKRLNAGTRYDLLCTDVNMPRMDGLKLVALVRAAGPHRAVPILVITTESAEGDRRRAMDLGASAYLVKPVQAHQVAEAVRPLLGPPGGATG